MPNWPDENRALIIEFLNQLKLTSHGGTYRFYRSLLQQFQSFVNPRLPKRGLSATVFRLWVREELKTLPLPMVVHYARVASRFLDWLAGKGAIVATR